MAISFSLKPKQDYTVISTPKRNNGFHWKTENETIKAQRRTTEKKALEHLNIGISEKIWYQI
jgi:hypothetical protein